MSGPPVHGTDLDSTAPYVVLRDQARANRWVAIAACGKCPATKEITFDAKKPPEVCRAKFGHAGWIIGVRNRNQNRCPGCSGTPKKDKPMAAPVQIKPAEPAAGPTVIQMFQIGGLLDDHFDEKLGRYEQGWSDERVSTELNIPRAHVIRIREEGYWGKIRSFDDLEALKNEADALREMVKDNTASLTKMIDELETRIGAAERKRVSP